MKPKPTPYPKLSLLPPEYVPWEKQHEHYMVSSVYNSHHHETEITCSCGRVSFISDWQAHSSKWNLAHTLGTVWKCPKASLHKDVMDLSLTSSSLHRAANVYSNNTPEGVSTHVQCACGYKTALKNVKGGKLKCPYEDKVKVDPYPGLNVTLDGTMFVTREYFDGDLVRVAYRRMQQQHAPASSVHIPAGVVMDFVIGEMTSLCLCGTYSTIHFKANSYAAPSSFAGWRCSAHTKIAATYNNLYMRMRYEAPTPNHADGILGWYDTPKFMWQEKHGDILGTTHHPLMVLQHEHGNGSIIGCLCGCIVGVKTTFSSQADCEAFLENKYVCPEAQKEPTNFGHSHVGDVGGPPPVEQKELRELFWKMLPYLKHVGACPRIKTPSAKCTCSRDLIAGKAQSLLVSMNKKGLVPVSGYGSGKTHVKKIMEAVHYPELAKKEDLDKKPIHPTYADLVNEFAKNNSGNNAGSYALTTQALTTQGANWIPLKGKPIPMLDVMENWVPKALPGTDPGLPKWTPPTPPLPMSNKVTVPSTDLTLDMLKAATEAIWNDVPKPTIPVLNVPASFNAYDAKVALGILDGATATFNKQTPYYGDQFQKGGGLVLSGAADVSFFQFLWADYFQAKVAPSHGKHIKGDPVAAMKPWGGVMPVPSTKKLTVAMVAHPDQVKVRCICGQVWTAIVSGHTYVTCPTCENLVLEFAAFSGAPGVTRWRVAPTGKPVPFVHKDHPVDSCYVCMSKSSLLMQPGEPCFCTYCGVYVYMPTEMGWTPMNAWALPHEFHDLTTAKKPQCGQCGMWPCHCAVILEPLNKVAGPKDGSVGFWADTAEVYVRCACGSTFHAKTNKKAAEQHLFCPGCNTAQEFKTFGGVLHVYNTGVPSFASDTSLVLSKEKVPPFWQPLPTQKQIKKKYS